MIDLGTRPVGQDLPFADLDADRMDYLVDQMGIAELPVVLDVFPRFDAAPDLRAALIRGRDGLVADKLLHDDRVHPDLELWLRTLEQPAWYVEARIVPRPYGSHPITRVCRASNSAGSVVAVRSAERLNIRTTIRDPARDLLDVLGSEPPFEIDSISAPTDRLAEALDASPTDATGTAARLTDLGIDASSATAVAAALATCTRHTEITCVTVGSGTRSFGPHPVAVFDTPRGRLVATSTTAADGARWTSFSSGSDARLRSALTDMAEQADVS
ncbi:ESX secretion-associated protein EspG [Rhodococcoides kyotonense]|uniref:ESX secretion-associated protein EspG n=1 Tax=Rhodococcoides kyotonense TaxID=398843 RepID=UPI000B790557|nr:ESX secretion-associated protein EspG [Rhodococcus kyotonensis]